MSFSTFTPEAESHIFKKEDRQRMTEERKFFPRCKPCGKYCKCIATRVDSLGVTHRHICCQCALRPSELWSCQLKRVMCEHAPPYREIPRILEDMWKQAETTVTVQPVPPRVFIVDFQGYKDDSNNFIMKELAAIRVYDEDTPTEAPIKTIMWTIIRPPYDINNLSYRVMEQYRYVSQSYHGLSWDEGIVSEDDAMKLLMAAIFDEEEEQDKKGETIIMVKGEERRDFLAKKIPRGSVVGYDGASLKRMQLPWYASPCPIHSMTSKDLTCSLKNCYKIGAHYLSTRPQVK